MLKGVRATLLKDKSIVTITVEDQECEGAFDFRKSAKCMTKGFQNKFGDNASGILLVSIAAIAEKYPDNADYLQVLTYDKDGVKIKYWMILDDYGNGNHVVTALLPEEYQHTEKDYITDEAIQSFLFVRIYL